MSRQHEKGGVMVRVGEFMNEFLSLLKNKWKKKGYSVTINLAIHISTQGNRARMHDVICFNLIIWLLFYIPTTITRGIAPTCHTEIILVTNLNNRVYVAGYHLMQPQSREIIFHTHSAIQ